MDQTRATTSAGGGTLPIADLDLSVLTMCLRRTRLEDQPNLRQSCKKLSMIPIESYLCNAFEESKEEGARQKALVDKFCSERVLWPVCARTACFMPHPRRTRAVSCR